MESDQTGFSGSSPSGVAGVAAASPGCNDEGNSGEPELSSTPALENRNQTYYNHCTNEIIVKDEPEDDSPTQQAPLPTISDENWRAFYQHNQLVVLNGEDGVGTVYETAYKLPSLGKISKGIVGKLPTFFGVTVAPSEGELITAHPDSSPVSSPVHQTNDTPTAIYLQRGDNKVIVHSLDRENSVIQPVPEKEKESPLPLLAPAAVEVKQSEEGEDARELQAEPSPTDIPLGSASYPTGHWSVQRTDERRCDRSASTSVWSPDDFCQQHLHLDSH